MSALSLNLYMKPGDSATAAAIRTFVAHVNANDYVAIRALDVRKVLYDVEDILAAPITLNEDNGLLHLAFDSTSSLEVDGLVSFFNAIGCTDVEISAFDSGTGETFYVNDAGEHFDQYASGDWQWLPCPGARFAGQYVVVTGSFSGFSRVTLEELIREKGGTVQKDLNGKTTLLVVGSKPGADKTSKANALGVTTMDEDEFLAVLAESNALAFKQVESPSEPLGGAYQYCFPASEPPIVWVPAESRDELYAVLHASGYLTDAYYQSRLETARAWSPAKAANFNAYENAQQIPLEERGPLNPRKAWEIAGIFSAHQTLINDHAHFAWETHVNGYAHALAKIAENTGMHLENIDCLPTVACEDSVTLSCVFEGSRHSASFKPSQNTFPKPFLRLLHEMATTSDAWDFVAHGRSPEQGYVLLPRALTIVFLRLGYLKPIDSLAL
ncbi:BRCT domain-containing protein [Pseudomonas sp. GV071]|uniref:BRCT domain-containing protein n=1 Tax=Pseudomonas sp. GV071 TaxID=2135754 RepID=UPI000D33BD41|nr:BRCT domain-containing protein [Pseudomonas sp. GV071]PTQ68187.1 BRCA1 C Terminus (BRCT) protein [Pseudomonas sp. GV071]